MATIVEGEASESDEEYDEPVLTSLSGKSPSGSITSRESPANKVISSDVDRISNTSATESSQQKTFSIQHKYQSIFQRKLVDEMFSLRGQVETIANKSYNDANKQMRQLTRNAENLTSDLKRSARQLQLLTNDLFRLEDKVDELNQMNILTNIRLSLPTEIIHSDSMAAGTDSDTQPPIVIEPSHQ